MPKHRYINTKFWDDEYVQSLNTNQKFLFLYCFTNPSTNIAGIYEITLRRIEFDTGIDTVSIRSILDKFETDKKVYFKNGWLIVCNFPKHQEWKTSPKILLGIEKILQERPLILKQTMDTLSIPYLYPSNYIDIDININKTNGVKTPDIKIPMKDIPVIELDNDGEPLPARPTLPKKYKHKGKFYARIIVWYMGQKGETEGNASRYLKTMKDLADIATKQYPNKTEAELEKEIKSRILVFKKFQESKNLDWSLNGVHNNWNKILNYAQEINFNPDEV